MPLRAEAHLRTDAVEEVLARLDADRDRGALELDFSALSRLERPAGAILSNYLLGTAGEVPLRLVVPREQTLDWLVASGLAFAVAHRGGPTAIDGGFEVDIGRWSRPWSTGGPPAVNAAAGDALFDAATLGETPLRPDLRGSDYAAFVDPHLAPGLPGGRDQLVDVLYPWLDRLLPAPGGLRGGTARLRWISEIGRLVSEIVGNVREHAVGGAMHSLVQLAVTRGGRGSHDRLHLLVQDTGPGIPATARRKVAPLVKAQLDEQQLLFKLCDGSLPPWGRARGMGLPTVVQTARRLDGSLRIWTKTTRVRAEADAIPLTTARGPVRIDGTVVALVIPLSR